MNSQPNDDPLCYWVLLTDSLHFCYTSPSFNAVVPQAKLLIGRPFFDYLSVQGNPSTDIITQRLLNCYSDEEGNGDVLHLNYATVSAIRFHLQTGHFLPIQPDYAYNQFAVVVSRAGGFILAFLHVKAAFSRDCNFHMCEPLKPDDLSGIAPYVPSLDSSPPYHVFQILLDDERRPIIFTTPTTLAGGIAIAPPVLAEGTQNSRDSVTNQGQTSCTKRTKLSFVATTLGGDLLNVSALLLRHGNALLVMYKISPYVSPPATASSPLQVRYQPPPGPPNQYPPNRHSEYRRVSESSSGYSHHGSVPQPGIPGSMHQPPYNPPYSPAGPSHHPRVSSYDSNYPPTSPDDTRSSMMSSPRSPTSSRSHRGRGMPLRRDSLDQATMSNAPHGSLSPHLGSLEEHKVLMHSSQGFHSPTESTFTTESSFVMSRSSSSMADSNDISVNNMRSRPSKEPPKGIACCQSCQTTSTPEWRKGPSGIKDLCNSCGLRWSRRVKKMKGEGGLSSENPFGGMGLAHTAESMLEPQRAGGGSKKGHRRKAIESRGPAMTTRPAKRRYSDASGMSNDVLSTSPQEDSRPDMSHDSYGGPRQAHPHNPHHSSQGSSSAPQRPSLTPLFDDTSTFSPAHHTLSNLQPHTPLTASSMGSRMDYRTSSNHQMKSPSSPEVTHGYFNPPSRPMDDRKPFDTTYPRPPGSPTNSGQFMPMEHAHRGPIPGERPPSEMHGMHGYSHQDPRQMPPHQRFDRHNTDPNHSNAANDR